MKVFVLGSFIQASCLYVPRLPVTGESLRANALHRDCGGKGFNLAVGAARLGAQVDLLMAVGRDAGEQAAREVLAQEGLSGEGLLVLGEQTGQGFGFVAANGANFLAVFPGANSLLGAGHVRASADLIARAALVYACFESADDAVLEAFSIARRQGVVTLLNPSPWRLPSRDLLAVTDRLIVNATEASELGVLEEDGLSVRVGALLPETLRQLVITRGEQGALLWDRDQGVFSHPGYAIQPCDTVGAGDAFAAAFAVAVASGSPLPEVLAEACAAGAMVCLQEGVHAALPRRAELVQWMRESGQSVCR